MVFLSILVVGGGGREERWSCVYKEEFGRRINESYNSIRKRGKKYNWDGFRVGARKGEKRRGFKQVKERKELRFLRLIRPRGRGLLVLCVSMERDRDRGES